MSRLVALLAAGLLGACTIAPQPLAPVPVGTDRFRHADAPGAPAASLAGWTASFGDAPLVALVDAALAGNFDIRAAAARVDQAQALLGVREAALSPPSASIRRSTVRGCQARSTMRCRSA